MKRTKEHPIRTVRKLQGVTLAQLSKESGVHISNISRAENRLQAPQVETYRRLGRALGVDWRTLVED